MKKHVKKGSLLIALSLLLVMMMGMTVNAASTYWMYCFNGTQGLVDGRYEYTLCMDEDCTTPANITTLSGGDEIKLLWKSPLLSKSVKVFVDGIQISIGTGDKEIPEGTYTYEISVVEQNIGRIDLTTYEQAPAQDNDDSEDEGDNDSAAENNLEEDDKQVEKKKEKKPEEPKESEEQIFINELLARAAAAKAGDTIVIDATLWHSFSAKVLEELLSKEGVNYTLYYNYSGECFYITIPAGAALEEGCEWYGPLKLNAMFGRTMIDKKDLYAAIDG